jgi:hypothetical protein
MTPTHAAALLFLLFFLYRTWRRSCARSWAPFFIASMYAVSLELFLCQCCISVLGGGEGEKDMRSGRPDIPKLGT